MLHKLQKSDNCEKNIKFSTAFLKDDAKRHENAIIMSEKKGYEPWGTRNIIRKIRDKHAFNARFV